MREQNEDGSGTGLGRPLDKELSFIGAEEYNHKVGVDLVNGAIIIDYQELGIQNGTTEIHSPKLVMYICDETNRLFGVLDVQRISEPDRDGNYINSVKALVWRPISFTRWTNGVPTYVVGAQTTLPENYGGKNVKKLISLYDDGSIGID